MMQIRCFLSSFRSSEMTALEPDKKVYAYNKKEAVITRSQHGFPKNRVCQGQLISFAKKVRLVDDKLQQEFIGTSGSFPYDILMDKTEQWSWELGEQLQLQIDD